MIGEKSVLAIIPARGGSKGVPRKNIREVAGKPLIAWTILEAKKSRYIDRIIVSTDDPEIADAARLWGAEVPFMRPAELAQDSTPGIDPVIHALESLPGYDYVVLLQPTSPLRTADDIDGCIALCEQKAAGFSVSVTEPEKSPYWMYTVDAHGKTHPLMGTQAAISRRQDLPPVYALNGAVYVADVTSVLEKRSFITEDTLLYIMPKEHSIDIDTETDLVIADVFLKRLKNI